jgi:tetratricopeptide (TPR) repeat protein
LIISGNLDEISIVDTFQLIGSSRRTGILRASQKEGEIRIYWKAGSIVYAEGQRPDANLPQRLQARLGSVWREAQREAAGSLGRAAQLLLEHASLGADELGSMAEESTRSAVEDLFSWTDGGFEFTEGPFPDGDIVAVTLHTPTLLVEGTRRLQRAAQLQVALPDRRMVFRMAALPEASLTSIRLESEEWSLLSLVNGRRTADDICRLAGGDELRTLQGLYSLLSAGLIVEMDQSDDEESGRLELGRVKYSRILEVYCELHTMLMDRMMDGAPGAAAGPLGAAMRKLASSYPAVWAGIETAPERELPGTQFLANVLKIPADQRTPLMMQSFGHLLLKEILVIRHLLGDDAANAAIADVRMVLQLGARRYPEVSSKVLRHLRDVLRQAEQIPSRYKMAFDFFESHRYEEAIRLWKSIPRTNPQHASAQELIEQARRLTAGRSRLRLALERGEHLCTEGRYDDALGVWRQAMGGPGQEAQDTEHETTKKTLLRRVEETSRLRELLAQARAMLEQGRPDGARRLLEEALSIAPDLDEATALLREAAGHGDKLATVRDLVSQGLELYRAERYPEAIELFRRVLALDARHQLAGDHLRFSYDRLQALAQASPRYAAALEAGRGGDHVHALELWEGLLQAEPQDAVVAFLLREERAGLQAQRLFHEAMTYYLDRNYARAAELFERVLEEKPLHSEARGLLEQSRLRRSAQHQIQDLLEAAERHFEAGELAAARQAIAEVLRLDPEHRQARIAQAQLAQAMRDESETGTFRTGSALISRQAEDEQGGTVRIVPEAAPPQLVDELLDEDGGTAEQAESTGATPEDQATPDLSSLASEVQRRVQGSRREAPEA